METLEQLQYQRAVVAAVIDGYKHRLDLLIEEEMS